MNEIPTPAPTFYDITRIPYIPWEPGPVAWILLVSCFLIILLLGKLLIRHRKPELRGSHSLSNLVRERARRCLQDFKKSGDTVHLTRLSLDVRNFLALQEFPDARSLTAGELRARSTDAGPNGITSVELRELAGTLADLDQFEYSPSPSLAEGLSYGEALVSSLERYISRRGDS